MYTHTCDWCGNHESASSDVDLSCSGKWVRRTVEIFEGSTTQSGCRLKAKLFVLCDECAMEFDRAAYADLLIRRPE